MRYTRNQMLNQLMINEYDYIHAKQNQKEHPGVSPHDYLSSKKQEYERMSDVELQEIHELLVDAYYESPSDTKLLLESDAVRMKNPNIRPYLVTI